MKNISKLDCQIPILAGPSIKIGDKVFSEYMVIVKHSDLEKLENDLYTASTALAPFAALGKHFVDAASYRTKPSEYDVWGYNDTMLTYGDFRDAYAVFNPKEVKKSKRIASDPEFAEYIRLKEKFDGE